MTNVVSLAPAAVAVEVAEVTVVGVPDVTAGSVVSACVAAGVGLISGDADLSVFWQPEDTAAASSAATTPIVLDLTVPLSGWRRHGGWPPAKALK
jgi:hypothetical protein